MQIQPVSVEEFFPILKRIYRIAGKFGRGKFGELIDQTIDY